MDENFIDNTKKHLQNQGGKKVSKEINSFKRDLPLKIKDDASKEGMRATLHEKPEGDREKTQNVSKFLSVFEKKVFNKAIATISGSVDYKIFFETLCMKQNSRQFQIIRLRQL